MGSSQQQTCAKCGKPKETADQASLTQWISACTCDQLELNNEEFESVQMCLRCMKRINPGRSGSLTQWVFRSDICNCDMPQPSAEEVLVAKSTKLPKRQGTAELDRDIYEREISVDARTFPLNRYKPLVVLGAGAFGQVYLCRDRLLNKKVAVKTIKNVHGSQLPDFQKEAKATSKLNHPGIVKVMDFGATESGAPFMVLDYVPGITLASYISAHGSLSPETTLQFALQLCEALAYVHKHSIFHRDIKPSNILLPQQADRQSIVQIIDFGIAKVRQPQDQPSQFLTIDGTPPYLSTDQFDGYRYHARSELYSLGCVMFEFLAGRPPYVGISVQE